MKQNRNNLNQKVLITEPSFQRESFGMAPFKKSGKGFTPAPISDKSGGQSDFSKYNCGNNGQNLSQSVRGFTLIELLVVLAIIGVLAGVVMLAVSSARVKARDAKRAGDMRQIITSLEQYYIQHGSYPTGTASAASTGSGALLDDPAAMDSTPEPFTPNYIGMMPKAPNPPDGDCDGTGRGFNNYWYEAADDGSTYTMTFCLGKNTDSWPAGTRYATPEGIN